MPLRVRDRSAGWHHRRSHPSRRPVGVGKSMLAQCLGSASVRAGHSVLFIRADALLAELGQARADRSYDKVFRRYLAPDLVLLDDFGLRRLTAQQSNDLYELIVERHRRASFAITSNRSVDEWLGLFDDPILGNSALDRLANAAHQIVIEGPATAPSLHPNTASLMTSHDTLQQHTHV
jgi:DNA replication protein DnaC